ncbi:hypothetical protein [Pelagibaculum spongiae]|uniref:Uncharacterized protein n=1 Tax=Pelagibaculum spongiae TaxID=2080658 RepID=A0A2V1GND4_9GAMM|nr:hypothetical protein [Pelagibaculum spongiae]PVZ62952.1 hypothetical protein DC094_21530 [Pelagibaculum spongiae]
MATTGASAREWLEQNGANAPIEKLEKILSSLQQKLEQMDETNPELQGILDAIDEMEGFILHRQMPDAAVPIESTSLDSSPTEQSVALDTSQLGDPVLEDIIALEGEEKQHKFASLKQQLGLTTIKAPVKPDAGQKP